MLSFVVGFVLGVAAAIVVPSKWATDKVEQFKEWITRDGDDNVGG